MVMHLRKFLSIAQLCFESSLTFVKVLKFDFVMTARKLIYSNVQLIFQSFLYFEVYLLENITRQQKF